ncbi:MAG: AEC family transporter [Defluviitaleaceae bacterium]|nr:AEC family transporter [Defluviitaleaceae bacterium]
MDGLFLAFSNSLTALALCISMGFACRRWKLINDVHMTGMSVLLVKIGIPCTVFIAMMQPFSRTLMLESMATFAITGIIYILGGYLGLLVARLMKVPSGVKECWQFGCAFSNVGFLGIPVVLAVFGPDGLIYVAMAAASFNILSFTWGVRMFSNAPREMNIIKVMRSNPAIPATIIGFILFATELRLPGPMENGIALIHGMTTPLSMILIGAILGKQRLKDSFMDLRLLPPTATRLIIIPLATLFILRWFIPNPLMLSVIVTMMAMPPAASTAIFAELYNGDMVSAAKFVVVPTVLCAITVPLIALLL